VNPLLQDILGFLHDGRQFTDIRPDKTGSERRKVEFVFPNGVSEVREYECDHATFMKWWKLVTGYLRSTVEAFRQAEERL
jgi:hypothetical protein